MALRLNKPVGRDSSGRIVYSGRETVGFRPREGGGFERGTQRPGETLSSTEKGGLIQERIANERKEERDRYYILTQTLETEGQASTVSPEGLPAVVTVKRFVGPASGVTPSGQRSLIIGQSQFNKVRVEDVGINKVSTPFSDFNTIQPLVQSQPGERRLLSVFETKQELKSEQTQKFIQDNRLDKTISGRTFSLQAGVQSFGAGVAISGARTLRAVSNPIQTVKSIGRGAFGFATSPIQTSARVIGEAKASFQSNPTRFAGVVSGDIATGFGLEKGFRAGARAVRFAGKTEIPAGDIVAPTYISGSEIYPTGTPRSSVSTINREGRAFSAMPQAPERGRSFTVLTQSEKVARGLDLSETGGLYAAPRVSPIFTQVVTKGPSGSSFSLIPRWGVPGSIAEIQTGAQRLPRGVRETMRRERSIRAGNVFLDETVQTRGTNRAFSTPATELGIKTEAEVIIPGGSQIRRTENYGWFDRATGRDFDAFVRVPKSPGSTSTVPVAIRRYENIGISPRGVAGVSRGARRTFDVSDVEYYRSPRQGSLGVLRYSSSLGRSSSSGGLFSLGGSGASLSSGSSSLTSSGLFSSSYYSGFSSRSSFSSGAGSSSRSSSRSLSSLFSSGGSGSRFSSSFSYIPPLPGVPKFLFEGDEGKKRKGSTGFKRPKRSNIYESSLTANVLNIRAGRGQKRATGFSGFEIRGV